MIRRDILKTLCCPVARTPLRMMTARELAELNTAIANGVAKYSGGEPLVGALESGLITVDGSSAYGIREGIPALLPTLRIVVRDEPSSSSADNLRASSYRTYDDSWEEISRHWDMIGPPIRPSRQDTETMERVVADGLASRHGPPHRALLLGVTPEIATMRWPSGTSLLALDAVPGMIRNVWPAREAPHGVAALADWIIMPVRDAAYDVLVGDASLTTTPYPDGFLAVKAELRRVLKDEGMLAMREFARPEQREPVDGIFRDLRAGRIASFRLFMWRLAMALHEDLESGCRWGDVFDAWYANVPDPDGLMMSLGWPLEAPRFLEVLRQARRPALFPTLSEMRAVLAPEFEQAEVHIPDYPDGDRYPTVVFKPKSRPSASTRA